MSVNPNICHSSVILTSCKYTTKSTVLFYPACFPFSNVQLLTLTPVRETPLYTSWASQWYLWHRRSPASICKLLLLFRQFRSIAPSGKDVSEHFSFKACHLNTSSIVYGSTDETTDKRSFCVRYYIVFVYDTTYDTTDDISYLVLLSALTAERKWDQLEMRE